MGTMKKKNPRENNIMGYMKMLSIIEYNEEFKCPICNVTMKLNKHCNFECPICTLEIKVNKKVLDLM